MSTDCIFCKIVAGEIPGDIVYQNEHVTAFRDINPIAPTHVLIIPNEHVESTETLREPDIAAALMLAPREVAAVEGLGESGYRLISNTGPDGRQEVMHLHIHLIGGRRMKYPIG